MANTYLVCLDAQSFSSKPTNLQTSKVSKRIANYEYALTLEQLSKALANGQTFVPATFLKQKREQKSFDQQQLLAVDIDKGNVSQADLLNKSQAALNLLPNIVYNSFTSSDGNKKWRLIYALTAPLELPQEVKQASRYLASIFGGDTAVAECARLLYGTNKFVAVLHEEQLDTDFLLNMAAKFKPASTASYALVAHDIADEQQLYNTINTLPAQARGLLHLVLADIRQWFADTSIKGSRYQTVFRSAVHLSVLSFMPGWAVMQIIKNEMALHEKFDAGNWQHADKAESIIAKAINWGKVCEPRC